MNFNHVFSALLIALLMASCTTTSQQNDDNMEQKPVTGVDGNKYCPL